MSVCDTCDRLSSHQALRIHVFRIHNIVLPTGYERKNALSKSKHAELMLRMLALYFKNMGYPIRLVYCSSNCFLPNGSFTSIPETALLIKSCVHHSNFLLMTLLNMVKFCISKKKFNVKYHYSKKSSCYTRQFMVLLPFPPSLASFTPSVDYPSYDILIQSLIQKSPKSRWSQYGSGAMYLQLFMSKSITYAELQNFHMRFLFLVHTYFRTLKYNTDLHTIKPKDCILWNYTISKCNKSLD
jgi:hypothetical protein